MQRFSNEVHWEESSRPAFYVIFLKLTVQICNRQKPPWKTDIQMKEDEGSKSLQGYNV